MRLVLALVFLHVAAAAAHAQSDSAFAADLKLYQAAQNELNARRGMPSPTEEMLVELGFHGADLEIPTGVSPAGHISAALGKHFPERTSLLIYVFDPNSDAPLRTWLLDRSGIVAASDLAVDVEALDTLIANTLNAIGVGASAADRAPGIARRAGRTIRSDTAAIRALSSALFPVGIVRQLANTQNLIIVPVLNVGTIPFAMLQPFTKGEQLVDRVSISIAPSLIDVVVPARLWQSTLGNSLIVGDPAAPTDQTGKPMPQLPGAADEAAGVAETLGAEPLIGAEATASAVSAAAPHADLLYFASHGVASHEDPLNSSYLALANGSRWTAKQIQSTKLKAQLAVLSACQTGLGLAHDGGMIGLARAFILAGTPRVVMSLWNVDDAATAKLMEMFVANLKRMQPEAALRAAMIEMKKHDPDPKHWAAFAYFGVPR